MARADAQAWTNPARLGERGGALTEFAVATLVLVPLVLYGIWFSDALHFATVAEEASIEPVFDSTAYLVHDFQGGGSNGLVGQAAQKAGDAVKTELSQSFDSFDTGANPITQSVFVRPKNLTVNCLASGGSGAPPSGSYGSAINFDDKAKLSGKLNKSTWITCRSGVDLDSSLFPHKFRQDQAHVELFDSARDTLHMCGLGPGIDGCGSSSDGFSIMLDDWAVENGAANPLSIGGSGPNQAYVNVGKDFYSGGLGSIAVMYAMQKVTKLPLDLGNTSSYRLTYQVTGAGSYEATEGGHGQSNPLGGPSNPHTGGPWHDEHSPHQNLSQTVFQSRKNNRYLSRSDFPSD